MRFKATESSAGVRLLTLCSLLCLVWAAKAGGVWGAACEKPHDESLVGASTKTSRAAAKRMRGGPRGQVTQASLQELGLDSQGVE